MICTPWLQFGRVGYFMASYFTTASTSQPALSFQILFRLAGSDVVYSRSSWKF